MDWVRMSSAIKQNRTLNFLWVWFPNQSNSIEQIEPNQTQSIRLCDWVWQPNWMDCIWLSFFTPLCSKWVTQWGKFIYLRYISVASIESHYKHLHLPSNRKHLQATGKQPVYIEGDLIVSTCLQFKKHGLSCLFSLKLWNLCPPTHQSGNPVSLLLRI